MAEHGFGILGRHPKSESDVLRENIRLIISRLQQVAPEEAQRARLLFHSVDLDLDMQTHNQGVYRYCGNNPLVRIDPFGLKWWWPPDWFKKNKDDKCCDQEAADKLIDETIDNLLDVVKKVPGKAGKIAKLVAILKKAKGTACTDMDPVVNACEKFAKSPSGSGCLSCCQQIYSSFGNLQGGVGSFACKTICKDFIY